MDVGHIDRDSSAALEPPLALRFEGEVRMQHFVSPFAGAPAVFAVHFAHGARTRPHLHRSGQILHICDGDGIVANETGLRRVGSGDVVSVSADEWHWHGAQPGASMTHLTIQHDREGETVWDVPERDWARPGLAGLSETSAP